jgi:hypothetical protein
MKDHNVFKQRYCFVESLDSVRYTKFSDDLQHNNLSDVDEKTKEAQAEIELIYALLLGHKIIVPESHSFDSVGFLKIITKALVARQHLSPGALEKDWIREPFILSKRGTSPSYLDMVSQRIENPQFILSALSEINSNITLRQKLAELILQANSILILQLLQDELPKNDVDNCKKKVDSIIEMNSYFSATQNREAKHLGDALEQYVRNLINRNNIPELLQREEGFNQLRNGLMTLEKAGIKFYDRSAVRHRGRDHLGKEEYLGVIEYVDSCYNAVIYQATEANIGILTTTETTRGRYVLLAQRLSEESASLGSKDRVQVRFNDKDAQSFKNLLSTWHGSRGERWKSVWEIMIDDRWIKSVNEFMQAPNETKRDAYRTHIKELKRLTDEYSPDISIGETEEFKQSLYAVSGGEKVVTFEQAFEPSDKENEFDGVETYIDGSIPGIDL